MMKISWSAKIVDDISSDVIIQQEATMKRSAKLKRRRFKNQQLKQSTKEEATSYGDSADGLMLMTSSVTSSSRKNQQVACIPDARGSDVVEEIQSQATQEDVAMEIISRREDSAGALHKWKEDKIAFWSAEQDLEAFQREVFYRGYILEATLIEEVSPAVQSERDAMRSFSWCNYNTMGNIH
ncbi:hypothetical protein F511_44541 [Dorcoceras hygrometricum]|uniref:Uncharacterized protein n=1 Tax=Dorcoceras hygrometricum TaxID=472368 RepID=A0A2Z7AVU5_9LAMI|nr:hypothetical protein F511_44541 [Dorcoceras hygrometricum]